MNAEPVDVLVRVSMGLPGAEEVARQEGMAAELADAVDSEYGRLGLPAVASVDFRVAELPRAIVIRIDGRRMSYPPRILVEAWSLIAPRDDVTAPFRQRDRPADSPDSWLAPALGRLDTGERGPVLEQLLRETVVRAIRERPSSLLSDGIATRYLRPGKRARSLGPSGQEHTRILRELVDLGVSLEDRATVLNEISFGSKLGLPVDDLAEHAFASLRTSVIEICAHPAYLERLTGTAIEQARSLQDEPPSEEWKASVDYLDQMLFEADGLILPELRLVPRAEFGHGDFEVSVFGSPVGRTRGLAPDEVLVQASAETVRRAGIGATETIDPTTGREASIIAAPDAAAAERVASVMIPRTLVLLTALAEIRRSRHRFLTLEDVDHYLEVLAAAFPAVVRGLAAKVPAPDVVRVLRLLLEEDLSIKDLKGIADAVVLYGRDGLDVPPEEYADACRRAFSDQFAARFARNGELAAIRPDSEVERRITSDSALTDAERDRLQERLWSVIPAMGEGDAQAVLLTTRAARRPLRDAISPELPTLPVLAHDELPLRVSVNTIATIGLS